LKRITLGTVVFFIAVYGLVCVYVTASALWQPQGTLGLVMGYGANVRAVIPGGAADRAGMTAGDLLDLAATPFDQRRYVAGVGSALPVGAIVHVRVLRGTATRDASLVAEARRLTPAERFSILVECLASLVFIVVGAALIVLRPGAATWGFGLYCLLEIPTSLDPFRFASGAAAVAAVSAYDVVQNVGVVGLLIFTLEFPRRLDVPLHRCVRSALPFIFIVLVAMTLYPDLANLVFGRGARLENGLLQLAFGAVFFLALCVLYDTYARIERDERERMRWILAGFGLGLVANYFGATLIFSSLIAITPPVWLSTLLLSLNVLLPLAIAHAVVRHRVLDINFVISRTLVYASLTTILAASFSLLDWFFGSVLPEFRLSRLFEAGLSICVAFAFDALHKRMEDIIESVFFRRRRAAQARVDRLIGELPAARTEEVIDSVLVGEVVHALALASAAVYRRSGDVFTRSASIGWSETDCSALDDTDTLLLSLRAQPQPVRLADLPWRRMGIPSGANAPSLAIPMHLRGSLAGVILYGSHTDGADIDPDESHQLGLLAKAASLGIDEIDADRLRRELDLKNSAFDQLEARLDELRRATQGAVDTSGSIVSS
jgi:hypothetical protein